MLIVRESFVAKPGMASKLAKHMKEVMAAQPKWKTRIMTDAVGTFNTVVMETEVEDLAALTARMKEYEERTDLREKMKGYTEMWVSGKREIFQTV
ncbi:MAG TPA: hypothetical protein VFM00_06685 [Candidatus Eisenbacteria bacterium]|nr:hypothetical protein [Candidatus Eisenbacteria bacterium]